MFLSVFALTFQESISIFETSCFQQSKGAFTPNPVSSRSKKRRLFDSWRHQSAKIKKAPFRRLFSIFRKIVFFSKIKGAFYFNCAPALDQTAKGAFFFKKYGLSAFTGKKIKSISFLVNFFEKFKIAHKIHFSN